MSEASDACRVTDLAGRLSDAYETGGHDGVGGLRAAGGIDHRVGAEPQRRGQQQLLVRENADWISATSIGPSSMPAAFARESVVELDVRRSASPRVVQLAVVRKPLIQTGFSHSSACLVGAGDDEPRRAVGDRRQGRGGCAAGRVRNPRPAGASTSARRHLVVRNVLRRLAVPRGDPAICRSVMVPASSTTPGLLGSD